MGSVNGTWKNAWKNLVFVFLIYSVTALENVTAPFNDFTLNDRNKNLIANFNFYPERPFTGMTITFNASLSYPIDMIERYTWCFGDGNNGSGMIVTHSYCKPGTYKVKLFVWDQHGNSNSSEKEVNVMDLMHEINSLNEAIGNLTSQMSSLEDRISMINEIIGNLTGLMQVLKNETVIFSISELRDRIINLTNVLSLLNNSIIHLENATSNLNGKISELRDEVNIISGRVWLFFGPLLLLVLFTISLVVFLKKQVGHILEDTKQVIILQREIEELKKSLSESSLFLPKDESIYNDFTRNIDIFKEISSLTGRSMEELYNAYNSYVLKEHDGKIPPIEGFLLRIGEQYKLNFIKVLEGQKPIGLVLTGKDRRNRIVMDAAVNAAQKGGFFLFQSILDEKLSSRDILKNAEKLKVRYLVSLSYVQKSTIPEIQLGSRNISDTQLISRIITDLGRQNIYVKKADERFLGGYLVNESEKYGIKCFQLTFLGTFSEGEFEESLVRILDTIFSNVLNIH